jgi:hypothetical protein
MRHNQYESQVISKAHLNIEENTMEGITKKVNMHIKGKGE